MTRLGSGNKWDNMAWTGWL